MIECFGLWCLIDTDSFNRSQRCNALNWIGKTLVMVYELIHPFFFLRVSKILKIWRKQLIWSFAIQSTFCHHNYRPTRISLQSSITSVLSFSSFESRFILRNSSPISRRCLANRRLLLAWRQNEQKITLFIFVFGLNGWPTNRWRRG